VGAPRPSPEIALASVATVLVSAAEPAATAPAASAASQVSPAEPTDRLPVRDRQHVLRHDLLRDPGHGGLRRQTLRGRGREPQHDLLGTARRALVPGVATVPLDRAVTAASVAVFRVAEAAFAAAEGAFEEVFTAAEVASVGADGVLTLGLSTISPYLAISTTA
jgi:hypothetical protein